MKQTFVAFMTSRNKDNAGVSGFHTRSRTRLVEFDEWGDPKEFVGMVKARCERMFHEFLHEGVLGETSRLYITMNPADEQKVMRELQHELIDGKITLHNIDSHLASLCMDPRNASKTEEGGSWWLFDADCGEDEVSEAAFEMSQIIAETGRSSTEHIHVLPTASNHCIVTDMHFDVRDIVRRHHEIEFKRDNANLFVMMATRVRQEGR